MRILQNARKCENFIQLIQTNAPSFKKTNGLISLLVINPQSTALISLASLVLRVSPPTTLAVFL